MRFTYLFIFILSSVLARAQVISFHDDSLKINKKVIEASTTPGQLDIILGAKHSTAKVKSDFLINRHTGKKMKQTIYYYPSLGISFRKYKDDPKKYSLSLKLNNAKDPNLDFTKKVIQPFKGYLFIAGNDISRKYSVGEIRQMHDVTIIFPDFNLGSPKATTGGEIIYQKDVIRLSIDKDAKEVSRMHFYHGF